MQGFLTFLLTYLDCSACLRFLAVLVCFSVWQGLVLQVLCPVALRMLNPPFRSGGKSRDDPSTFDRHGLAEAFVVFEQA